MGDQNKPKPKTIPKWLNFVIGGTSGMMSTCFVQPADLVKTRMQLMGPAGKKVSTLAVAREVARKEGVRGFYRGLTAALFRQATYTTGRMGCFNSLLEYYKSTYGGTPNFATKICLGMVAGGVGAFAGTPAEVALVRMTADGRLPKEQRRNYTNVFNALGRITREEGVTALWRGAGATITRAMVVNAAQLGTYAQAREALLPSMGEGILLHFCASMISGLVTSAASLPVDIVKTRVQNAAKGTGQVTVLLSIIKNEGVFALWRGFLPTYAKIGPHTVLTFIFMEQLNSLYFKMA
ncbi:mitochondrial 2-oxoglutarate/malate carrier protein-like [Bombyx mandarina]|uniref:Mitochondrial 2-oxoglutarate/malate carrier protein-like n=1 Tax=Bombyx mandarina TaxID=7092 RepID=A0A6J2JID2_BOMMA|nr:mitochondrial 2-oxoglutarate/malate carrier protein-like [Bombyx mandarina]